MARGRMLLGRLGLVLAVVTGAFVGAKLGLLDTREVRASHNFGDVPDSAFFHDFVDFLVDHNLTAGCGAGQFCPNQAVTRGQQAVFLKKFLQVGSMPQVVDATGRLVGRTVVISPLGAEVVLSLQGRLFFVSANTAGFVNNSGFLVFTEPLCAGQPFVLLGSGGPNGPVAFPRSGPSALRPPGNTLWGPDSNASPIDVTDATASVDNGTGCFATNLNNVRLHPAVIVQDLSGLFQPPFDLL
jgi:S-layer homology domain